VCLMYLFRKVNVPSGHLLGLARVIRWLPCESTREACTFSVAPDARQGKARQGKGSGGARAVGDAFLVIGERGNIISLCTGSRSDLRIPSRR
jgi:hypothetical protein